MSFLCKLLVALCVLGCFLVASNGKESIKDSHTLAVNDFAVDLYRALKSEKSRFSNIFFSPYSIYTALAMLEVGARSNTRQQLRKAMNWDDFVATDMMNKGHMAFQSFNRMLMGRSNKGKYSLNLANKLWLQKYFENEYMKKHFTSQLMKFYSSDVGLVNFAKDTENARKEINKWVEKQTNAKIKDLIKPNILTSDTRLVITNAIHFKGAWKTSFDENKTKKMKFDIDYKKSVEVEMMAVKSKFRFTQTEECKAVELPYDGDKMSMVVFVPRDGKTLDLDPYISAGVVQNLIKDMVPHEVYVKIPKFKVETTLNLKENLNLLGIKDMFDQGSADLSGILGVQSLYISKVVHKAFVEVNEEGTEAAAATGIVASFRSLNPLRRFIVADRPFLFVIRDIHTGTFLFVGRVVNPTV